MYNYIILYMYIYIYIYICFWAGQDLSAAIEVKLEEFQSLTKPEQLEKVESMAESRSSVYCGIGCRQHVVVAFRLVPFPIGSKS